MPFSKHDPADENIASESSKNVLSDKDAATIASFVERVESGSGLSEKDLFLQAFEIEDAAALEIFLDRECGEDPELRGRLDNLLDIQARTGFLEPGKSIESVKAEAFGRGSGEVNEELPDDNYAVGDEIARGGMGSIRIAEDQKLERSVAIKVMHCDVAQTSVAKARFLLEAKVLAQLAHPNIVPIYDIVWEDGNPLFYSMKLVKGRTLQAIIDELRNESPKTLREYNVDRLLQVFRKVCDAMAFSHSRGIIHRDLKPENIMVGEFGEVLVMDWGLAKRLGDKAIDEIDASIDPATTDFGETLQGDVMGTPQYMSPEQANGDIAALDQRSDIFSLGGILYAILTLRPPVEGKSLQEILDKVSSGEITSPTELLTSTQSGEASEKGEVLEAKLIRPLPHSPGGKVGPALSSVAMKALSLLKKDRYQKIAALAADIESYQGGFATQAEQPGAWKHLTLFFRRHRAISLVAAAAVLLLAVLSIGGPIVAARQTTLAEVAKKSEEAAAAASREAQRTLVDMQTSRGINAAKDGDHGTALLWFAEAAKQASLHPERRAANLLRAGEAARNAPIAVGGLKSEFAVEELAFLNDSKHLVLLGEKRLIVRDWQAPEQPPILDIECSTAGWNEDGDLLAVADPERNIHWYHKGSRESITKTNLVHPITAIACAPSGRHWAFTVSGRLRICEPFHKKVLDGGVAFQGTATHVQFSPDGDYVAIATKRNEAWVFKVEGNRLAETPIVGPVPHHHPRRPNGAGQYRGPIFADEGRSLLTVDSEDEIARWKLDDSQNATPEKRSVKSTSTTFFAGAPTARHFAVFRHQLADFYQNWEATPVHSGPHRFQILDAEVSRDGRLLFTSSWDGTARLTDFISGRPHGPPLVHDSRVERCAISPDGILLATADKESGTIRIWHRPKTSGALSEMKQWGVSPRLSPDGTLMTPGRWVNDPAGGPVYEVDQALTVHTESGRAVGPPILISGLIVDSCPLMGNEVIAIAWLESEAENAASGFGLFNVESGDPLSESSALKGKTLSVAPHPTVPHVAVLDATGCRVIDGESGGTVWKNEASGSRGKKDKVQYTPDGHILVIRRANKIHVLNSSTGDPLCQPLTCRPDRQHLITFALCADSKHLVAAEADEHGCYLRVWDLKSGAPVSPSFHVPGTNWWAVIGLAFSLDGDLIAAGGAGSETRCWDWRSGKLKFPPLQHESELHGIVFAPGGQLITASGSTIAIWDTTTGKLIASPTRKPSGLGFPAATSLAVTPDGKRLLGAHSRTDSAWVMDLEEILSPPDLNLEEFGLLAECSVGTRIIQGDRSNLSSEEWLNRFDSLQKSWRWERPPLDVDRWLMQLDQANSVQHRLDLIRVAADEYGVLEELARLRPESPEIHLILGERIENFYHSAAAEDPYQTAADLFLRQLQGNRENDAFEAEVAECLIEFEVEDGFEVFRELWQHLNIEQPEIVLPKLNELSLRADGLAAKGDLEAARKLYRQLAAIAPDMPQWNSRLDRLGDSVIAVWRFQADTTDLIRSTNCEFSTGKGYLDIRTTHADPQITFDIPAHDHPGGMILELRYRVNADISLDLFWSDGARRNLGDRRIAFNVNETGKSWTSVALPFMAHQVPSFLRIDPGAKPGNTIEIESMLLRSIGDNDGPNLLKAMEMTRDESNRRHLEQAAAFNETVGKEVLEALPNNHGLHLALMRKYLVEEAWTQASRSALALIEATPDHDHLHHHLLASPAVALGGNESDYRDFVRLVVERFAGRKTPMEAESICRVGLLLPNAIDLSVLPEAELARGLDDGSATGPTLPQRRVTRALLAYRQGDANRALEYLASSGMLTSPHAENPSGVRALGYAVSALAHRKLGNEEEAGREQLAAREQIDTLTEALRWSGDTGYCEVIIARIIFEESEASSR